MKNQEKLAYETPNMEVFTIELEQGIASASTGSPALNDWEDGASGGGNWEGN